MNFEALFLFIGFNLKPMLIVIRCRKKGLFQQQVIVNQQIIIIFEKYTVQ